MSSKRCALIVLVLVAAATIISACVPISPESPATEAPPTAPPQEPTTAPPQDTPVPPPTDTPEPTDTPPPEPTDMPTATSEPTPTPTPTPQPRPPKSEGPLDFKEPAWVHAWEPLENNEFKVVVKIEITGGAPPFTVKHDETDVGRTWERTVLIEFIARGCGGGLAHTITVDSADGQSVTHDYWLAKDLLEWCE